MNRVEEIHDSVKAVALSSHLGRTSTYQKITTRFYWYTTVNGVAEYIKSCTECQRHLAMLNNVKQKLKSISVTSNVMKRIDVDLCSLPKVDVFEHVVVSIVYFPKGWKQNQVVKNLHQRLPNSCMSLSVNTDVLLYRKTIKVENL